MKWSATGFNKTTNGRHYMLKSTDQHTLVKTKN